MAESNATYLATEAQEVYNKAHHASEFYCLDDPCPWHPYEQRMTPRPRHPATLVTEIATSREV